MKLRGSIFQVVYIRGVVLHAFDCLPLIKASTSLGKHKCVRVWR